LSPAGWVAPRAAHACSTRPLPARGFMVQGAGFRVQGSGFRVQVSGFRVQGSEFRVQGSGFRVQGSGFGAQGSGFRVQGFDFRVCRISARDAAGALGEMGLLHGRFQAKWGQLTTF